MWITYAVVALLGVIFGSFASAVAHRAPRGESFTTERSCCPSCGHVLGVMDLFPIISWLWLRGKCRYCQAQFGVKYIALEITMALLFVMVFYRYGMSGVTPLVWGIVFCMVLVVLWEQQTMTIPYGMVLIILGLSIVAHIAYGTSWYSPLTGGVIGVVAGGVFWQGGRWLQKKQQPPLIGRETIALLGSIGVFLTQYGIVSYLVWAGILTMLHPVAARRWQVFSMNAVLSVLFVVWLLWPEINHQTNGLITNFTLFLR